jgi:hypothetical protein
MNPEFRRNLWLELTPRRIIFMVGILALVFFAASVTSAQYGPASAARTFYMLIVVLWGTRNAALSVVGEIRDRTWDGQRLSSIGASQMTWGKLFGATIYNWFGGAICLAVMLIYGFAHNDPVSVLIDLVYLVALGLIAQSASLLASLIAVRRRQSHSRLDVFLYQLAGLIAAVVVSYIWAAVDPAGSLITGRKATEFIVWWGATFDSRPFLLMSLVLFEGWILVGCYREMRRELQMRNGPLVWLGFLAFMGLYVAGFDAWLSHGGPVAGWDVVALRLALAGSTFALLTYVMVLLEPKDRVLYRWFGSQLASGRIDRVIASLQAWMMNYTATVLVFVALIWWLQMQGGSQHEGQSLIAAGLGFVTRDVAIFVLFATLPSRRRGDFAAVIALVALYVLIPAILDGVGLRGVLAFFYPHLTQPLWLGPAVVWGEAIVAIIAATGRLALGEKSAD